MSPNEDVTSQAVQWLRKAGPEGDVVISSRVRLARNVAGYPFLTRASEAQQREIEQKICEALEKADFPEGFQYFTLPDMDPLRRQALAERRLVSRELAEAAHPCGVGWTRDESLSAMANEEDHLRIQGLHAGMEIRETWKMVDDADSAIERHLSYAFHPELGYLTACPTNVGTGMRASVMLHLPALALTGELKKIFAMASKIDFAVRGLYGESSDGLGDFYQVSNQKTLGRSEEEIVGKLETVIPEVVEYERRVRNALLSEDRLSVEDRVFRAYGLLRNARRVSSEEALHLLSHLRLGVNLRLLPQYSLETINSLFVVCQPAHLRIMAGRNMDDREADEFRAHLLRKYVETANDVA